MVFKYSLLTAALTIMSVPLQLQASAFTAGTVHTEQPSVEQMLSFRQIQLTGSALPPALRRAMEERTRQAENRPVSFQTLRSLASDLTSLLRSDGYLAGKVIIPEQTFIAGGTLSLMVLTGRLDRPEIRNHSRMDDGRLAGVVSATQCAGNLVKNCDARVDSLFRSVSLLNEIPGVSASYSLEPGTEPGTTKVVAEVKDTAMLTGYAGMDNHSTDDTGKNRYVAGIRLNNLTGFGDLFASDMALSTSGDLFTGSFDYSLPVGYQGMRAGLTYDHTDYQINGAFSELNADGKSDKYTLWAGSPLLRTPEFSLDTKFRAGRENTQDNIDYFDLSQKREITFADAALSGQLSLDNASGNFSYGLTYGHTKLRDAYSSDLDEYMHTAGNFALLHHDTAAELSLADNTTFYSRLRGQFTSRNLSPSMKFVLGGADGVRAYGTADGVVDQGQVLTTELRQKFPLSFSGFSSTVTVAAFFDQGWGEYNRHNPADIKNFISASGAGLWVGVSDHRHYDVKATWAHRTGNAITEQQDSSQFWLNGYLYF